MTPTRILPTDPLASAPDGAPVSLRQRGRFGRVVVAVHEAGCAECAAYLRGLAAAADPLQAEDGRLYAVVPGPLDAARELHGGLGDPPFPVLADPAHALAVKIGVDDAAVLVADQWGELHLTAPAGADHGFPTRDELIDWLAYLSHRCPECEGEAL